MMNRTLWIALLSVVASLIVIPSEVFARNRMYHPGLGRFFQRDPLGTTFESIQPRNMSDSQFTKRDIPDQYQDGMNLYQYTTSNPLTHIDPMGLWEDKIHYAAAFYYLDREGYNAIAKQVAAADMEMDNWLHGAPSKWGLSMVTGGLANFIPGHQEDYNYHFPGAGPVIWFVSQQEVVQGFANIDVSRLRYSIMNDSNSPKYCDIAEFGKFLHMLQDSWSHGDGVPDMGGHPKGVIMIDRDGNKVPSKGLTDPNVDDDYINNESFQSMCKDTETVVKEFIKKCPCAFNAKWTNVDSGPGMMRND